MTTLLEGCISWVERLLYFKVTKVIREKENYRTIKQRVQSS